MVLYHAGDMAGAIMQQHKELIINERCLGLDHPDTAHRHSLFYWSSWFFPIISRGCIGILRIKMGQKYKLDNQVTEKLGCMHGFKN